MEGYIDFELQKYKLLAYLKEVRDSFNENKLYPQLSDIVFHYKNLLSFQENKRLMQDQFPKKLDSINVEKLELMYEKILQDSELMNELSLIADYAVSEIKPTIKQGAEIFEQVEKQINVEPVGILPLYKQEGYALLHGDASQQVFIYQYHITLFTHAEARYKGIHFSFLDTVGKTLANTYNHIKINILKTYSQLPNPAVYKIEYPSAIPLNETLLPITKRVLVRYIET